MNSKSPYLDAVQNIPGKTAKEKYESLNKIINQTIDNRKQPGDSISRTIYGSKIPKVLEPLVETEIAKIQKKPEDVIAALKSEDAVVINRGLQASWLFDGSIKSLTNFNFFSIHIFPQVSLNTRANIIKRLSQNLGHKKEYIIAQEFFEGLKKLYNLKQAKPLLSACSENYLAEIIKNKNIILPKKLVTRLFSKYPDLVIHYFKFGSPAPCKERVVNAARITDYNDILPKLVKKHLNDFVDIINSYDYPLQITLGKKCAEFFLESKGIEALINSPKKFLPLLPLKIVTKKLNEEQFKLMFQNKFPKDLADFCFNEMLNYLEFQPEEKKLSLILDAFQNVYKIDLLTLPEKVTIKMLLLLPSEERAKIAKRKLIEDPEERYVWDQAWICFLLTSESIPKIKEEISNSKNVDARIPLVGKLFRTCQVNKSEDDLLQVLQYLSTKHRNEISYFWLSLYDYLMQTFSLELLSEKHWAVINEMIQRSYVKNILMERLDISERLLEKSVLYNLEHSLPIEDRMTMLAELKIKGWNSHFSMLKENPKYEKICLKTFLELIPRKFPNDHSIWENNEIDTLKYLINDIYDYNTRMKIAAKKKQKNLQIEEELTIRDYPWLLEKLKKLFDEENNDNYQIKDIKELILVNERKLYDSWFQEEEKIAKVDEQEGLNLLKKNPEKILKNWEEYLKSCEQNLSSVHTRKFLKKCTWYSEIPIKFLEKTLKRLDDGNNDAIMILALLLRGPEFEQIIQSLVPNSDKMEIDGENARDLYKQASSIPPAINEVNPPPPLKLVAKFCHGDYLHLGLVSLMNVARRVSVQQVTNFARNLIEKPISVKKHGIRLLFIVSPSADLCEFLRDMWNTEKHKSIREVVFEKSYRLFCDQPCDDTWKLIRDMIQGLTVDDRESFNHLKNLNKIPNEYVKNYFELTLKKVDELRQKGTREKEMIAVIINLLSSLTPEICDFFTEEYCQFLLQQFTFDLDKNNEIIDAGCKYATLVFLNEEKKLEMRLNYFCNLLHSVVKEKWDKSHKYNYRFYPMRQLFSKIVKQLCYMKDIDEKVLRSLINLFENSSLRPVKDFESYLLLYFSVNLKSVEWDGNRFGAVIGNQLPQIVKIFSSEMLIEIGKCLASFLNSNEFYNNKKLIGPFTQALCDTNTIYSSIITAVILYKQHTKISDDLYTDIVQKLQKVNHPTVESFLNKHIVSVSLSDFYC